RYPTLVAIVQMPHVGILGLRLRRNLVPDSPQLALGRFDLDYVGTEVGQNHRRSWTSDETGKIDNLQSGENVVSWICVLSCHKCFLSWFSVLGIGLRAFAGKPASLLFCLPFRRRVQRAKLRVISLRFGSFPDPCSLLRVSTSLRS